MHVSRNFVHEEELRPVGSISAVSLLGPTCDPGPQILPRDLSIGGERPEVRSEGFYGSPLEG
jgi:hypothetical protein